MGAEDKTTKTQPEMAQPEHHRAASIRGIDEDEINTINDGGDIMDSKEQSDEPVQNIFNQGGKNYRTLGKWDTVFVLVTNQVGLGVLSLPGCLKGRFCSRPQLSRFANVDQSSGLFQA